MENKKGNSIFLGVVAVATLIVAIIGATFAYFSISAEGDNTVSLSAYEFNASISVSPVYPTGAASLVPLNPATVVENATGANNTNLLYALNEATDKCIDSNGFQVCAVYSVTIENNGAESLSLTGNLTTLSNIPGTVENATGLMHLKYAPLTGDTTNGFTVGTAIDVDGTANGTTTLDPITVPGNGSSTSYFVIYLNEAGAENNVEMGASYEGKLVYTSGAGGQQLTGTFRVASGG